MKKFFAIAIIATAFVACNNSGKGKEGGDTTKPVDTGVTPQVGDTTQPKDTTAGADTTAPKM
jgi:hypothetical protein